MEFAETKHGSVVLMTGDTPELVTELHAMADRTNKELQMAEAAEKAKKAKEVAPKTD